MEKYESIQSLEQQQASMRVFTGWVILAQVFGLTSVILVAVWMGHYHGGFAWQENPEKQFNYHPLFMVIGLIFLYAEASLAYRVFRNDNKIYIKVLHAVLQVSALIFAAVGLKAVFDSHNLGPVKYNNLYSLHSWLGLATVILFGLQWLGGLISFLVPGLPQDLRALYKPFHVYWGLAIFVLATATALTGITEKAWNNIKEYSHYSSEGILINFLGLSLVGLALTVGYLLTNSKYSRQPNPEEEHLPLTK